MQPLLVLSEPESTTYNPKRDLYQEVTNKIIALIERGVAPWRRTWSTYGMARNYVTGHVYTGINFILMNNTEHPIPYFMTYNQVKYHGGRIRPGTKAEMVIYFNVVYKDSENQALSREDAQVLQKNGEDIQILKFIKFYHVFNLADIEGIEFKIPEVILQPHEKIERCEDIIDKMPNRPEIKCIDASRAFYAPVQDFVNMPDIKQFDSAEDYYASLFHELIHSTGHASRLARDGVVNPREFGSNSYSCEELVAEMGASFLCSSIQIDYDGIVENNASYLAGWLKVLKEDTKFIFKAAAEAQKAADFILKQRQE